MVKKLKDNTWITLNCVTLLLGQYFVIGSSLGFKLNTLLQIFIWINIFGYLIIVFLDTTFVQRILRNE